jgi:hypothetical protein
MNWNKRVRQTHRWLSIAFTVAVIVNGIAVAQKKYTASPGRFDGKGVRSGRNAPWHANLTFPTSFFSRT